MNFTTGDAAPAEAAAAAAPEKSAEQEIAPEIDAAPTDAAGTGAGAEPFADAQFEQELKAIYAQSDPEQSAAELRAEFGPEYDTYLRLASGFAQIDGFAEAQRVLEVAGIVNHPAITRFLMNAGRTHYTIDGAENMAPRTADAFDEALESIRERQAEARSKGSGRKADALYQEELALIARQNGAGGIVDGRRTA